MTRQWSAFRGETFGRILREHTAMTIVAWASVVIAVSLSVGAGLGGSSLRATLVAELELAYHDVLIVRESTGLEECPTPHAGCVRGVGAMTATLVDAVKAEYGDDHAAEAVELHAHLGLPGGSYGTVRVVALDEPWLEMQPVRWIDGRPFSAGEMRSAGDVLLVGKRVFDSLATLQQGPVREVRIGGHPFAIVGIIESGVTALIAFNNAVVIPRRAVARLSEPGVATRTLLVSMAGNRDGARGGRDDRGALVSVLRQSLRLRPAQPLSLEVSGADEQVGEVQHLWTALRFALIQMSILLAIAASVSIGALQFTVAASRRQELGVRRAVGARRLDLVIEGIIEAGAMALVGALGGALLAIATAWVVAFLNGWVLANVWGALVIGVAPCLLLGGGAGAWASARFARQSPSELLGGLL